jgi:hypothetical protein
MAIVYIYIWYIYMYICNYLHKYICMYNCIDISNGLLTYVWLRFILRTFATTPSSLLDDGPEAMHWRWPWVALFFGFGPFGQWNNHSCYIGKWWSMYQNEMFEWHLWDFVATFIYHHLPPFPKLGYPFHLQLVKPTIEMVHSSPIDHEVLSRCAS